MGSVRDASNLKSHRGFTTRSLYNAIYDADAPEQFLRTIPAQSFYLILKQRGLAACTDLLEIAPLSHIQTCVDLDLWTKDTFTEENFWEWLSLSDDEDPLRFTQLFVKAVDLKLIALLISRHVVARVQDEPSENPPGAGFYTPDKGYTWLHVAIEDSHRHFLFCRLLALIFETNAELFYQLLSIPTVSTDSVLEEEAFRDRSRRLAAEGIPEFEYCEELNSPLTARDAQELIKAEQGKKTVRDVYPVEPLIYGSQQQLHPLSDVLAAAKDREAVEAELSLIMNASIQFFSIPFYDFEAIIAHTERVRGALNIGLERVAKVTGLDPREVFDTIGLQPLYRVGISELRNLSKATHAIPQERLRSLEPSGPHFALIAHLREVFPCLPAFVKPDGTFEEAEGRLLSGSRALETLSEVEKTSKLLELIG